MVAISEIDAIKAIDDAMSQVADPAARSRILRWAWEKYSSEPLPGKETQEQVSSKPTPKGKLPKKKAKNGAKLKSKTGPSIVRDLNLKPQNKESFQSFAQAKNPQSDQERCVVAVFYLRHELGIERVGTNHVFTCFKDAKWRVPVDLANTLQYVASHKGWFDTSDMSKIELTTHGENLIEHDLPRMPTTGK